MDIRKRRMAVFCLINCIFASRMKCFRWAMLFVRMTVRRVQKTVMGVGSVGY